MELVFRRLGLGLALWICAWLFGAPISSADAPVRVGIYQNEPLVFVDPYGHPAGFYVELLEAVAAGEGWDLEYVECLFPDCLAMLERGEIDLMTAIAYSEERDRRFDFTQETVLANWGQVYIRKGGPQSIPDLEGQTVAVVREDIYYAEFRALVEEFGISCEFVEVDDYAPVLERVAEGETNAGLVARLYGLRHEREYNIVRSPIVCCAVELRFASAQGRNRGLLDTIDRYLTGWKEDPGSVYYQALDRWFEGAVARPALLEQVPLWARWSVVAMGVLAFLGFGGNLLLRAQVRARTRQLRQAEARYRGLFERVPIGLYSTTPEGEVVEANPALVALLGFADRKSLLGVNVRDLYVNAEDRQRELAQIALEGVTTGFEMRLRRADGSAVWVRDHSRAVQDAQGQMIGYEGALEDITERKEAEERLEKSEALFRALAEEALVGVYLIQDGLFGYVNPALAAMFGYQPAEVIGHLGPLDLTAPEDRERVVENIRQRIEREVKSVHYTFRGLRKDGTTFDCEVLGGQVEYEGRIAILGTLLDITERRRMEQEVNARTRRQSAIARLGVLAFSEEDVDTFLNEVASLLTPALEAEFCQVLELLPGGERLLLRAGTGWKEGHIGQEVFPASHGSYARYVLLSRKPVVVEDLRGEARFEVPPLLEEQGVVSGVSVLVGTPEQPWGVLGVHSARPRLFDPEEVGFIQSVANIIAQFVARAAAEESVRRQTERLALLHRLGERLSSSLDIHTVAQQALNDVCAGVGALRGIVLVWDPDVERLRLVAVSGYDAESVASLDKRLQLVLGKGGLVGWVGAHRRSAIVADVTVDERWLPVSGLDDWVRSALSVPLIVGDELIGVMSIYSEQVGFFDDAHRRLVESAAATVGIALANARLYEREQKRARQLALVAQIARQIVSILDPDELLREVVEQIVEAFGYDYAAIMLLDPEAEELLFATGAGIFAGRTPQEFRQKRTEGMIGWVADRGETLLANDVSREPRYIAPYLHETQSELDVPLKHRGRIVGVLDIQSTRLNAFDEQDVQAMEALAGHIATAIENARLYAQLQTYAESLEQRVEERTVELRRERERMQAVLDAAGEGVFVTDSEGCIEYMNPAAERMTGFHTEELRGQHLWVCAADGEQVERMQPMRRALQLGEVWRGEATLRRKDGTPYDATIVVAPIPGEGGRPSGSVGIVEDITPFKELDRLKSRFITNVSHELRTPIATVKLYAELARRQPHRQSEHLAALEEEANRLARLVEDILEISQIEAGRLALEPQITSLHELTAAAVERYQVLAADRGVQLEYRPGDRDSLVEVDVERMKQVLDNLLSNAIEYTLSGGRVVVSTGRAEAEGHPWATVTVADTGIGIPESELPHIFERFFRGDAPRRMQISGTGLGLSIVKEIVEMFGGFITVESRPEEGSIFTVWLPLE